MFNFFRQSVSTDATDSRPVPHPATPPAPPSTQSHADIQRELVRAVLKDTLRRHGIPTEWLGCEVTTVANRNQSEELHIQLVLLQWHELLLRYARALELQLLRGLDRFEPHIDHAKKCTIAWRLSPDCGSPFTVMPPPVVWAHEAQPPPEPPPVAEEPPSVLDRRQKKRPPKGSPDDYERTELSPFR